MPCSKRSKNHLSRRPQTAPLSVRGSRKARKSFADRRAATTASRGISANTIASGAIETDFGGGRVRDNAEINEMVATMTALGRAGLPDDVESAVAALLSDSGWITGQRIEVSGGMQV